MEVESKHNPISQPFSVQTPARHDMGSYPDWLIMEDTSTATEWHLCSLKNINIFERMKQMNLLTLFF